MSNLIKFRATVAKNCYFQSSFFLFLGIALVALLLGSCATAPAPGDKKVSIAEINSQLGMAYLARNDMQLAKEKLLLALEEDPKLPAAWYSMAYFFESTGDTEQAKKYYLKAISLAPTRGDVQNNYGTFLCHAGNYHEAIQHFLLATQDLKYLQTASAYENAGLCSLKIPDQRGALAFFNKAIQEDSQMPVSLFEAANLDYQLKNYAQAKFRLKEYLAVAPANTQTRMLATKLQVEAS